MSIRSADHGPLPARPAVRPFSRVADTRQSEPEEDCWRALEETRAKLAEAEAHLARHGLETAELNHRVANSLQIVAGFLTFQERKLGDSPAKEALTMAGARIAAVAGFHRHLAHHAGDISLDLAGFLEVLVPQIGAACGLRCQLDAEPVDVAADAAMTIALVLNELAINARKYAYDAPGGALRIRCKRGAQADLVLSIADDGPGLPPGFDFDGGGLGSSIMQSLTRQLGAHLSVETGTPGACFVIRAPLERLLLSQTPSNRSYSASGTP